MLFIIILIDGLEVPKCDLFNIVRQVSSASSYLQGSHGDPCKDHCNTDDMVKMNLFIQKDDRQDGAEYRHEMNKRACLVSSDGSYCPVPEDKRHY